ncbi:MAG: class IV adenylate cyclase [Hymenobacteraceae bacterium]|nr:class IV adenylate cyclase [Hymenobacteraceae bacterium]MDX5482228.1 class IV adenylate cyclase [Hymenobacteraceae bacterium]
MYADITIKAHCYAPDEVEHILLEQGAAYKGLDVQTDTFYEAESGKLKHRQGTIENVLIHYKREQHGDAQRTEVSLYLKNPSDTTIAQLCGGRRPVAQVRKLRKIFFIENVKFHLDQVEGLGSFVEIEAIDLDGSLGLDYLKQQCQHYQALLGIVEQDLVQDSYIDMDATQNL